MIAIICLDNQNGRLFNHRRQSRDQFLLEDILSLVTDNKLYVSPFSKTLFEGKGTPIISENYLEEASRNDFCFIEEEPLAPILPKINKLIVYKWNKVYPQDVSLDISISDNFSLDSTTDFKGFSHDKITREVYVK